MKPVETPVSVERPAPVAPAVRGEGALAVNHLARAYQPRRVWAAAIAIGWNLLISGLFAFGGGAAHLYRVLAPQPQNSPIGHFTWISPIYCLLFFSGFAALNFPLEFWFGYYEERQFGLAKEGVRAWARDWMMGTLQHGVMFTIGGCALLFCQIMLPDIWMICATAILLGLFIATTRHAADLIPRGLFHLEKADAATQARLTTAIAGADMSLPPVIVYSHPELREFAGGIIGLGARQALLISRSSLQAASDGLLRFVLLHDLGHRHYHHNLLAALAGWAWVALGLAAGNHLITAAGAPIGSPVYIAWLAFTLSAWMAIGEPVLAYLGRRLEYQADRFYLRNGGTLEEMRAALDELARQNLARTEAMRRRETIFHPLPSVGNRIFAATRFAQTLEKA